MSQHEKLGKKSQKAFPDNYRTSRSTMVSPLMTMGAQGYSSDEQSEILSRRATMPYYSVAPQLIASTLQDDDITSVVTIKSSAQLAKVDGYVRNYIKQKRGPQSNSKYNVKLQVQYETEMGDHIAVVGEIDELGNWQDFEKCTMKWTEGHVWETDNLIVKQPFFLYKYVVMKGKEVVKWEKGANRIADLHVLPDMEGFDQDLFSRSSSISLNSMVIKSVASGNRNSSSKSPTRGRLRFVNIQDEWEHFKIKFSINDPIEEQLISKGDFMRIIGSTPKLGSQNAGEMDATPPMKMSRVQRPIDWLIDKYGQFVRPWEITISFQMGELELPSNIIYNYTKSNENGSSIIKERDPCRSMKIQTPETYQGELGKSDSLQFKNQQKVWIVNGVIEKADANFLGSLYFDKIGDTRIYLGTYPLREDDIKKMVKAGITGVLNLQTKDDIEQRGIPWDNLKKCYLENNIQSFRFPIKDYQEDELCAGLFVAAQHLNNMINQQNMTVYVHCSSGISRSPAVALVYLSLFKRVKQWQNPKDVAQFVKAFHVSSNPNIRAVQRVVEANQDFQSQQIDHQQVLNRRNSLQDDLESFSFPQMHSVKRDSVPQIRTTRRPSAYYSRQTSNMKPYKPKQRPESPQSLQKQIQPFLNKYKSQLVAQYTIGDQLQQESCEINPFVTVETEPIPESQNLSEIRDDDTVIFQTKDNLIETTEQLEEIQQTPDSKERSIEEFFPLLRQMTPSFDENKFLTEFLEIQQLELTTHFKEEEYKPTQLVRSYFKSEIIVAAPRPNLREIQKQKRLEDEQNLIEEEKRKVENRRLAYLEAKKVAEQEAIKEFEEEQAERRAKEAAQIQAKITQELARRNSLIQARQIAYEENQKIAYVDASHESSRISLLEDELINIGNERKQIKEQRRNQDERLRDQQDDQESRAQRAQIMRQKRMVAEAERKEREHQASAERELEMIEEAEKKEQEAKIEVIENKESPTKQQKSQIFRMTQTIQSSESNMIETQEHFVISGPKAIGLKSINKHDEDKTNRKQEERLIRASESQKAVEQEAQEAAKESEAERLRNEETAQEAARQAEVAKQAELVMLAEAAQQAENVKQAEAERLKKEEEEMERLEEEMIARQEILRMEEQERQKMLLWQEQERQGILLKQEQEQERQEILKLEVFEQRLIDEARQKQDEEKRLIQEEIREIEEQRRQIDLDQIRMEEQKRLRIIQVQKSREKEWRKREEEQLQLQEKLQKQRNDFQILKQKDQKNQEQMRIETEIERNRQYDEELRKRDEEQRIKLEEIKAMELQQLKNDEMEALSKFILFDMVQENVRNVVSDLYFEMEFHQMERDKQMLEQAKIEQESLKQQEIDDQNALIQRNLEEELELQETNRTRQLQEDMQREQQRLRFIAQENDKQRQIIAQEAEQLRQQEEEARTQAKMRQIQIDQERELDRQELEIILKEKNLRLELLEQQEIEEEKIRQEILAEERAEKKRLSDIAEKEIERIRQLKIKSAHEELLRLQNLRKDEEHRLNEIKISYEQEEKNREIQLQIQEEIEIQSQLKLKELEDAEKAQYLKRELQRKQEQEEKKSKKFNRESLSPRRQSYAQMINPHEPSHIKLQSSRIINSNYLNLVERDANVDTIEKYCDEIFREAPIEFTVRKGNKLEEQIQKMIKKLKITIPIIHIRQQSYLVGTSKVNLENKFQSIMIRVGGAGGVERFDTFMPKNHRKMQRQLVDYMSKSQNSLSWVIEALIKGERIQKQIQLPSQANMIQNHTNQDLIKKVNVNLNKIDSDYQSNKSGMRSESFLSRESGSRRHNINLSTQSGIRGFIGRTSQVITSRQMMSPIRGLKPIQTRENGNVFYNRDTSPARFSNQPQAAEMFDHTKILERMFPKKTNEDLRSMGYHHSQSPNRF